MLIRCSSLGNIMGAAKSIDGRLMTPEAEAIKRKKKREPEEQALLDALLDKTLSAGAETYLKGLAKEVVYGYRKNVTTKYMEKGTIVEDESIALYNSVFFYSLRKNTERKNTDLLTGEADIVIPGVRGIDIKSAWNLDTFPSLEEDCHDSDYEWQARGYMHLWDLPEWQVAYCMVSTPDELIRYEQRELHEVDHIDPQLRVTTITYKRDMDKEARMLEKAAAAQQYITETIERIKTSHGA